MHLVGGLVDQEQPADAQDEITSREAMIENEDERFGQANDPADEREEHHRGTIASVMPI